MSTPKTLFDKIWDSHLVDVQEDGTCLIYIDRQLIHEITSAQAFDGLRDAGRKARRPEANICVPDHNVPTTPGRGGIDEIENEESRIQLEVLEKNAAEFGLPYIAINDIRQGIVHVIGPEQGFTQPGVTLVCGDSHTATHGAFGALAFGVGTSEVEHVLATQTLIQRPAKNMRVTVTGALPAACTAKDMILAIIGKIGTAGGTGHVIEYAGDAIAALSMEGRMTVCNMSIEAGARAGLMAPDETTFAYARGRPMMPKGDDWERAVAFWRTLPSDEGATYDTEVTLKAEEHDRFCCLAWQHTQILIAIVLVSAFVPVGAGTKGNVVSRRQKIGRNQSPACREDIEALQPITVRQKFIGSVLIELPRLHEPKRVVPRVVIISEQRGSP